MAMKVYSTLLRFPEVESCQQMKFSAMLRTPLSCGEGRSYPSTEVQSAFFQLCQHGGQIGSFKLLVYQSFYKLKFYNIPSEPDNHLRKEWHFENMMNRMHDQQKIDR